MRSDPWLFEYIEIRDPFEQQESPESSQAAEKRIWGINKITYNKSVGSYFFLLQTRRILRHRRRTLRNFSALNNIRWTYLRISAVWRIAIQFPDISTSIVSCANIRTPPQWVRVPNQSNINPGHNRMCACVMRIEEEATTTTTTWWNRGSFISIPSPNFKRRPIGTRHP